MTQKEHLAKTLLLIEEAFDENERIFHEFFELAPDGITILDVNTLTFTRSNTNAQKLLKYSSEQIKTMGPATVSPEFQPDGRKSDEKAKEFIELALKGEQMVFEWLVLNGEGKTFFAEVRLAVIKTREGNSLLYTSFVDITQRKKAERQIELQNQKLYQIATIQSHQVRQPVANIQGLVNIFNFKDLNDPLNAEILRKVETATKQLDSIISQIVEMTDLPKTEH